MSENTELSDKALETEKKKKTDKSRRMLIPFFVNKKSLKV